MNIPGVSAEGKARHEYSWGKFFARDVPLPAVGRSILFPAEYLESKPPLLSIDGVKWNTTVLRCRQ
jgi:hypothetical protein